MQILKMDFQSQSTPPVVPVMQSDAQSRFIGIALYDGGAPYAAPENAAYTVQYHGPGPNNMGWYDTISTGNNTHPAVTVDASNKHIVTLELAEQALRVNGNVFINLCVVTSTGYMLHTFPILCRVTGAAYIDPAAVRSFFYVTGITNDQWLAYVTACQDAKKRAEDAAATFETDPTLSVSGKAADAAKVGEAVNAEAERAKGAESQIKEEIGNLNKEKLDSDVVYEVGDDGEVVSSTKMMDISGNGEIAKISADSVYKDNIIPLPNIAEKIVNGLTYSVKDGIISLNGTATTYTLIDLGVNLSMMDGLSAIGYKIFVLDGTHPSGMSILLGISLGGYAQTLTNTVQEKKSSSLITFNNKNISISINNNTAVNVKFEIVVIPINDIPSKFNVGKKYTGYMLNQLICTNNMWAFGTNISKIKLAQYYRFRKNKLYGKSLFVVGDSVAFGFGSGGKSYADIIAEKNKMSMKKVAVSGTTFAKRDGLTNSILEQVQTMDKMYDYVLIEGGFNDYFQKDKGVAIGTIPKNMNSSRDDKTTYGALDSICLWLKQKYPSSKLLFIVPHKIMTSTGVLDDGFYPYLQAIRNVCEKYSISYADIALKGGCTPFYQEFRETYFSGDGIHPNLDGYESFYVPRIEAEMEML